MKRFLTTAAALALLSLAVGCTEESSRPTERTVSKPPVRTDTYLRENGAVWASRDAMKQGREFIRLGLHKTNPFVFADLIRCVVTEPTKISLDMSTFSILHPLQAEHIVLDGPKAGCRGWVGPPRYGRTEAGGRIVAPN